MAVAAASEKVSICGVVTNQYSPYHTDLPPP